MGYTGSLNILKMNYVQAKAYKAWKDQGQRCSNPNDARYYCYGAMGIRREHTSREFITWYEQAYRQIPKEWKRVQCGRIDHVKNYNLGNVQLEACTDNTKDRNFRHGNPQESKMVKATHVRTKEVKIFESRREACRILGISRNAMKHQMRNGLKRLPTSGWVLCSLSTGMGQIG